MKKQNLLLVVLFLLLGIFTVNAQNLPSIRIVNNTGHQIYFIYVSPVENDFWGNDLLGSDDILENGEIFTYQLPELLSRVNEYDILLIDEEGDNYVKSSITITNNAQITFTADDLDDD